MIHSGENLIALSETPAYISKLTGRKKQHVNTIYRWSQTGVAGVLLETLVIGDSRYTSKEALERFWADSTAARNNRTPKPTINRKGVSGDNAEAVCQELGI
jgi:hypothetical protein